MSTPRDIKAIECDLTGAVMGYNASRINLRNTLRSLHLRARSEDRLLNLVEEFGVDHALKVLAETPEVLDFERAPTLAELAQVKPQLTAAHDAQGRADLLMAEKENLLREKDPSRPKAILVAGRETVVDTTRGVAIDVETGREEALAVEHVHTRDLNLDGEQDDEQEQGM